MTIEKKRVKLWELCEDMVRCDDCPLVHATPRDTACDFQHMEDSEIDRLYSVAFPDTTPQIKDSGERREFATGAVRDIQEGKGRCDLMPLDVVAWVLGACDDKDSVLDSIHRFMSDGDWALLYDALEFFRNLLGVDYPTLFLDVAKHFEAGAQKYGEWNWQKGIPVKCYIDSAVRHYLKYLRGDNDEPHDRAFVWNIMCCIWTCKHKPELNDYRKDN